MSIQQTVWGNIEWMEPVNPVDYVYSRVGIETIEGHSYQRQHIHYDEQIIQVLSGSGQHWISDKCYALRPGRSFYIPNGEKHELINTTDKPLRLLIFSTTAVHTLQTDLQGFSNISVNPSQAMLDFQADPLSVAIGSLSEELKANTRFPFTIFDTNGFPVFLNDYYPLTCRQECESLIKSMSCPCMSRFDKDLFLQEASFACRNGIRIFSVPILYESQHLGYIHGGYLRNTDSSHMFLPGSFPIQQNTVESVFAFLRGIRNHICDYCHLVAFQFSLEQSKKREEMVRESLRRKEFELSNMKINYHFLFNTMNHMAAMALEGQNMELYRSIVQLSSLFQYTLRARGETTKLKRELDYVRDYLELQRLRYGSNLEIRFEISDAILEATVPINFLQPLVENCFTHGFDTIERKILTIRAFSIGDRISVFVENNGRTLSLNEYSAINANLTKGSARGMGMVYNKLSMIYETFTMRLSAAIPEGSVLELTIPFGEGKND